MAVRLGTNPIAWSNDDDRSLGAEIPLSRCLAEAAAAGFTGIEMGHKFPQTAPGLREALAPHGLALVSGWYSGGLMTRDVESELRAMAPHTQLLKAMGCSVVIYCETTGAVHGDPQAPVFAQRPVADAATWRRFVDRLNDLGERLAAEGLHLAYHHHMGTVVQTEAELDQLMADTTPAVGLLFDSGHLAYAGGQPAAAARRHAARIVHVHTKDIRPNIVAQARAEDWPFIAAVRAGAFTVPGDGALPLADILAPLAECGYAGWIVVEAEQDPAEADPGAYARAGYQALRGVLADLGLELAAAG